MHAPRIVAAEWGLLEGKRPRIAGSNARLPAHGIAVRLPILRITTDDGATGFGACYAAPEQAAALVGAELDDLFAPEQGVRAPWLAFEYPIWDLAGQRAGLPVYALVAAMTGAVAREPFHAPCYDTSLYFDDMHLDAEEAAAELIAAEARDGYERGHRAF
ncbi:MAG TPA: hypothetical protein VER55_12345 [Ardenticatenaceae bacterium]|nr:hypothetical protein [Ardenticatenaceae bacterium]